MSKRKRATTPEPANLSEGTLSLTAYEADVVSNKPHLAVALDQRTRPGESQAGLICMDDDIWVDRYEPVHNPFDQVLCKIDFTCPHVHRFDVRLLLPRMPESSRLHASEVHKPENEGWDELPSDAEDMWFFGSEEAVEYRYKKRRRLNDDMRNARLRQMAARTSDNSDEIWGGSDEEVFDLPFFTTLCT